MQRPPSNSKIVLRMGNTLEARTIPEKERGREREGTITEQDCFAIVFKKRNIAVKNQIHMTSDSLLIKSYLHSAL